MQIYHVSEVNRYVREILEDDPVLHDLWLQGEVSNFTRATSGHLYFTLKDDRAAISCVMWRTGASRQQYLPRDGDALVAHGRISVYEVQGRYQFYADMFQPAGIGLLHLEFERLKERLADEGLFDEQRKRPLPSFPRRVGVVTSPVGAALRDILQVLSRRYPLTEVILAPSTVQGAEAPTSIVAAIQALDRWAEVDLIIVARGGGSLEELWAFNDERVARAITQSAVPVVSGVGHETDFTIADFAADRRAPTPSAAAELSVPDRRELQASVAQLKGSLIAAADGRLSVLRSGADDRRRSLQRVSPQAVLSRNRQYLDELIRRAVQQWEYRLSLERERVSGELAHLRGLSPLGTLNRGYAVVRQAATGQIVRSVDQVDAGDQIRVQVSDGDFGAAVR